MKKKILINALYPEERRVAIVEADKLVDFYVEAAAREHLKGNIYKGVVARIEPSIQAVFVDFGQKKHGFLQMREIMAECFAKKQEGKRPRVQDVMAKGHALIVQVEKDERETKGATLTTYLSLPGRYMVMMPGQSRVGISRKIEAREDRDRLKELFTALKLPKNMGFIMRTAAGDVSGEELSHDLKYLTKLWNRIKLESKKTAAPALIYKEQDLAVRTVRDYLTSEVDEVLVDSEEAHKKMKDFLKRTLPWLKTPITLYREKRPIFSLSNLEQQIAKIHERHVYLPSKGYIVFDRTEALTAIDVNSGRSRREENVESTALRTNLEAADEIARQLRLRDIGGLIVIDFIDMELPKHRREVESALRKALVADKAHAEITGISKFGIVEMTRERMRPAYLESVHVKCPTCEGMGIVKSEELVALGALREVHARAASGRVRSVEVRLPVASANHLVNARRQELVTLENVFGITVSVVADTTLQPGQSALHFEAPDKKAE